MAEPDESDRKPVTVAVCVATLRRPEGLRRLLAALDALELPPGVDLRVVVADNDPEGSARAVCEAAAPAHPVDVVVEPRRGIPQARNAALRRALGGCDLVAFLDDDGVPEPDWLAELLRVRALCDADVATGPCLPHFPERPPAWVVEGAFFAGPRRPSGTLVDTAYTHNALVRADALHGGPLFDEGLALTGGEDSELFERLARAGRRIVWADGAVVREWVPASRVSVGWILRRAFRVGCASARLARRRGVAVSARVLLHGAWCLARGAAELLVASVRGRAAAVAALRLAAYGAGRIGGLAGLRPAEYRRIHGS